MKKYDYDLIVIGAGSGGVRASRKAAGLGKRVALIEGKDLGGTCVNVGCVPKKLFSYASKYSHEFHEAQSFGWEFLEKKWSWPILRENKDKEIHRLNEVYSGLIHRSGVNLIRGYARINSNHSVMVNNIELSAELILIATGSVPVKLDIPGSEHAFVSDDMFHLEALPHRAVVIGGGFIGLEFASILNGFNLETTLVYRNDLPLKTFDRETTCFLKREIEKKGVAVLSGQEPKEIIKKNDYLEINLNRDKTLEADLVLFATGRKPNIDNLGLDAIGVKKKQNGAIEVDEFFQTSVPSIYAIGDVIDTVQLTPVAIKQAMIFVKNLEKPNSYKMNYKNIPKAVFSQPELAVVGLTEEEVTALRLPVKIYKSEFKSLKLSLSSSHEKTWMKMIVCEQTDKVLGVHLCGESASEMIQLIAAAMHAGVTKAHFDETVGVHPTLSEELVSL